MKRQQTIPAGASVYEIDRALQKREFPGLLQVKNISNAANLS
ncbi:MAG: hypothetical protein OXC38_05950 [Gammaproteobacteria bacterium]|nr:hypothetical protein [Gammaproteobacteria bacterium]